MTPCVWRFVTVPVTIPGALLATAKVKLAVVVLPPETATFCVTLWNPLAEATNWMVPAGIFVKLKLPVESVVAVPPPKVTVAPAMGVLVVSITFPVTLPRAEDRVIVDAARVFPVVTVTVSVAGEKPVADATRVTDPAGTLLSV